MPSMDEYKKLNSTSSTSYNVGGSMDYYKQLNQNKFSVTQSTPPSQTNSFSLNKGTEKKKSSVGKTLLNIGKGVGSFLATGAKDIVLTAPRTAAAFPGILIENTGALAKHQAPKSNILTRFAFRGTEPGTQARAGAGGELAIDLATLPIGGSATKTVIETAAKEGVKKGVVKGLFGSTAKEAVKNLLTDAGIGASTGYVIGLQEEGSDLKQSTLWGAVFGIIAPKAFHVGIKSGTFVTEAVSKEFGGFIARSAESLELKANRRVDEIKALDYFDLKSKPVVDKNASERIAEKLASSLRTIEGIPTILKRGVNRYWKVEEFANMQAKRGKITESEATAVSRTFMGINNRAAAIAGNKLKMYGEIVTGGNLKEKNSADLHFFTKQYMRFLDAFDDLNAGKKVEGGYTEEELVKRFDLLRKNLAESGQLNEIKARVSGVQSLLRGLLDDAYNSGRITKDSYQNILNAHPNYVPHQVISESLGGEDLGLGKSFGESTMKLKKRKGGERSLNDLDVSITNAIFSETYKTEKQRAINTLFNVVGEDKEFFNIKPLRTAEQVLEKKRILTELKDNIEREKAIQKELIRDKRVARAVKSKAEKTLKELDEAQKDLYKNVTAFFGGQGDELLTNTIDPRIKNIPNELRFEAEKLKDFKTFDEYKKSATFQEQALLVNRGYFEKYGFKGSVNASLRDFFDSSKHQPRSVKFSNLPVKKPKVKLPSAELLSRLERNKTKLEQRADELLNVDLISIEDAVKNSDKRIANIKATKDKLRADLGGIDIKKMLSIDVPDDKKIFKRVNNGIEEVYLMDKDFASSIQGIGDPWIEKAISIAKNSKIGKVLTTPAKTLRGLATIYNLSFGLYTNPIRDIQTARMFSKYTVRDLGEAIISTIWKDDPKKGQLHKLAAEEGLFLGGLYREYDTPEAVFEAALREGGILGKTMSEKLLTPVTAISAAGGIFEESVRLSVFRNALRSGDTPRVAVDKAANATVDFGKKGDLSELLNMFIPFFNAGVQGSLNFAKMIGKDPQGIFRKGMIYGTLPTVAVENWNQQFESRKNIPSWEEDLFWSIIVSESEAYDSKGNKVLVPHRLRIPKGVPTQLFSYVTREVLRAGESVDKKKMSEFIGDILKTQTPLPVEQGVGGIMPSGIKLATELKMNKSFFTGKEITPEWVYRNGDWYKSQDLPKSERYSDLSTSELAVIIGKAFNWEPSKVDYVIKTGTLKDFVLTFDLGLKTKEEKEALSESYYGRKPTGFEKLSQLPFLRSVIKSDYYGKIEEDRKKELEKVRQENKDLIESKKEPQRQLFIEQ